MEESVSSGNLQLTTKILWTGTATSGFALDTKGYYIFNVILAMYDDSESNYQSCICVKGSNSYFWEAVGNGSDASGKISFTDSQFNFTRLLSDYNVRVKQIIGYK